MTIDQEIALENCLLRGREIALSQEEPSITTGREALLNLWKTAPKEDRDRINSECERMDALLKREGL